MMWTVVLVLGLERIMNHIGFDEEYTLGSSNESSDGITYGKTCGFIAGKSWVKGRIRRWGG